MVILALIVLAAPNTITAYFLFTPHFYIGIQVKWLFTNSWLRDPGVFYLINQWLSTHGFHGCLGGGLCSHQLEGAKGAEDCVCQVSIELT